MLGGVARKYAHKIPFMLKFNHNEFLTYPNKYDQIFFAASSRRSTWARSRWARRSTSAREESARQIMEVSQAFQAAHEMGMATVLWCYLRNRAFKTKEKDFHVSADLTGPGQPPRA